MGDRDRHEELLSLLADSAAARGTGGGWSHVPTWEPAEPERVDLPEMRVEAQPDATPPSGNDDADLDETSVGDDLLSLLRPMTPDRRRVDEVTSSIGRLGRRAARAASEAFHDPTALLWGAAEGSPVDAVAARFMSHPAQPGGVSRTGMRTEPALAYDDVRGELAEEAHAAEERSPHAYGAGETAGALSPLALGLLGGAEAAAPAAAEAVAAEVPALTRIATTAADAAGFGAGDAALRSDADTVPEFLGDVAESGVETGALGGALGSVGVGARYLRGRAPAAREAADLAGLATLGGGRGTISRTDPRLAEFARLPGGIAGQAERARRLGLIGGIRSPSGVARRSSEVLDRILNEGAMAGTRREIAESGAEMPVSYITDALERHAQREERSAARSPFARLSRDLADRFRSAYGSTEATTVLPEAGGTYRVAPETVTDLGATLPYSRAIEELSDLSGEVPWGSDRLSASASMGRRGAVREGMDNWIETQPGVDLPTYREGRLDAQTAIVAARQAAERAAQIAGNNGLSLRDVTAMSGAQSVPAAVIRFLASRGWSQFGQTARAEGREMIARALASIPQSTPWSETLRSAAARGSLPAVHALLMRSDPQYAATVEGIEQAGSEASTSQAADMLSADQPVDLDEMPAGFVGDDDVVDVTEEPEGFIPDDEETP